MSSRADSRDLVDKMTDESNATCVLLRRLAVSILDQDDDDDKPAVSTVGQFAASDSAKYLLREVVNPLLCVVS